MSGFLERLQAVSRTAGSLVCVGLDPDRELMAVPDVAEFNAAIVDATKDVVCAYKLNLAFYEVLGIDGLHALQATVAHIRNVAPHVQILADAKRGDIDSTNAKHAEALFEVWGFDAATVNAYAGGESLQPLLEYTDKGVFGVGRSSGAARPIGERRSFRTSGCRTTARRRLCTSGWLPEQSSGTLGATWVSSWVQPILKSLSAFGRSRPVCLSSSRESVLRVESWRARSGLDWTLTFPTS